MIDHIIPLIGSYFSDSWFAYFYVSIIALAFVATVPNIVRYIFQWR